MRRTLIAGLLALLAVSAVEARRQGKKAGEITGDIYRDSKYGFELKIHGNWKHKIGDADAAVRISLIQRSFGIPVDFVDNKEYTTIPQLLVFVDTSSLGAHVFIDSLLSPNFKSDQKNDVLKEFVVLAEQELVPLQRSRMEIAGQSALLWKARAHYKKDIPLSSSSTAVRAVRRSYGGAIAAVKVGNNIVLFHVMSEWEFFEPVLQEVLPMIESLKVLQEEES
ncbi:MAG: hypothetical protein AB1772_08550 [Candidatus Zixiibacteriota bacterium]